MDEIYFNQSTADPCVYIKESGTLAIVAVYVDDLIVIASTVEEIQWIKKSLALQFQMKDMGKLHYCLINIEQNEADKCLLIHQKQYIFNMLEKYKLSETNTVSTPADISVKLTHHSTTGNVFLMAGGPISWLSKKQAIVALSTSEA